MPASRPATASRCSRPIHPTSSRPPTPAGRSAPSPSSSTGASDSRGCGARCGAPSHGGCVGTRKTLGAARALRWAPDARPLELASLSGDGAKLSDVVERHAPGADALAAVVFTSGATGPAKGVLYDQRTMAAQYTAVRECYAIGADDRLVAAFAPFALYGPALGIPVAVPDCDITKPASLRAEALADACAAVEATIVFAAPAALDGVLASQETLTAEGREALAALRLVLSAGAPVPQRTLEAFSLLAPAAELHTPYGMTEVLSVADIDLETLARVGPGRGVCVGLPLAGVGLRIEPLPGGDGDVRRDRRQRAVAVARLRRALGDERPRPDRRRAGGGVASHGRRRAPRRRRATLGRGAARARRRDGRRPGDAGAARDRGHGGDRPALRGDGSRPGWHASRSSWSSRTRARPASPRPCIDQAVREALPDQPLAAVLSVPHLPVDVRHNSKVDRTRLGRWAGKVLAGGAAPRRV